MWPGVGQHVDVLDPKSGRLNVERHDGQDPFGRAQSSPSSVTYTSRMTSPSLVTHW